MKSKIVDCFMFGLDYELELLELRLEYLDPVVDHFVLVEAKFTQLGNPKELFFEKNKERFSKYLHKIIHVTLDNPVSLEYGSWDNENFQRNSITLGLSQLDLIDNDIVIISDLDEFPSSDAINFYSENNIQDMVTLNQDLYYYYLNYKSTIRWYGSQLVRANVFKNGVRPQRIRNERETLSKLPVFGGWHFSYMGGVDAVIKKIHSVCESSHHEKFKQNKDHLESFINCNKVHFDNTEIRQIKISTSNLPFNIKNKEPILIHKNLIKKNKVTINCVTLIFKSTKYLDFIVDQMKRYCVDFDDVEVTFSIVANNATDKVKQHLLDNYADLNFYFYESDPGGYYINRVYQAYNYAAMVSNSDYVCFLNSDHVFSPNWLKNLYKHITDNRIVSSLLIESGKLLSKTGTISCNFGTSPDTINETEFLKYVEQVSQKDQLGPGILYMPSLIKRDLFLLAGGFPPGNVYNTGIGAFGTGHVIKSGDTYFFEDVLKKNFNVEHLTSLDSIVYNIQEGEKDE